jgi:hypothetical protein
VEELFGVKLTSFAAYLMREKGVDQVFASTKGVVVFVGI